jgi:hypothetical protein
MNAIPSSTNDVLRLASVLGVCIGIGYVHWHWGMCSDSGVCAVPTVCWPGQKGMES